MVSSATTHLLMVRRITGEKIKNANNFLCLQLPKRRKKRVGGAAVTISFGSMIYRRPFFLFVRRCCFPLNRALLADQAHRRRGRHGGRRTRLRTDAEDLCYSLNLLWRELSLLLCVTFPRASHVIWEWKAAAQLSRRASIIPLIAHFVV